MPVATAHTACGIVTLNSNVEDKVDIKGGKMQELITMYNYYFDKSFIYVFGIDPNSGEGFLIIVAIIMLCMVIYRYTDRLIENLDKKILAMKGSDCHE